MQNVMFPICTIWKTFRIMTINMVLTINESLTTNVFVCLYYFFINRNTTNSVLQRKGVQELRNIVFLANTVNVSGEKMHLRILRRLIKKKRTWNFQSTHCFFYLNQFTMNITLKRNRKLSHLFFKIYSFKIYSFMKGETNLQCHR